MNNKNIIIKKATVKNISIIQQIVYKTWPVAYEKILSDAQLKYMLQLIYSTDALQKQLNEGQQFYIAELENQSIGFAAFGFYDEPSIYKLHKLYVLPETQGTGIGKMLLEFIINEVKKLNATSLILNVNRNNKAKIFYEKNGFKIIKEEDIDIGNGYFMNDYVMEIKL
ncbi:MAG: GNAT family N-acetyltransferase [Chitinophagaceae bacterium]